MRIALFLILVIFATCKKPIQSSGCPESGIIKTGNSLGLWCKDASFIVTTGNSIIQPVIGNNLLNGFSEGDKITFGYREVFVAMLSCGENIKTVELLCIEKANGK
jgi:hypothetical protein